MRKLAPLFLLVAGLLVVPVMPTGAAPSPATSTAIDNPADAAAAWLAAQADADGKVGTVSNTAAAALALLASGTAGDATDEMVDYLEAHLEEYVDPDGAGGDDVPGALATMILIAVAHGDDPTSFGTGTVDLVARLDATQQGDGLYGTQSPSFDGAFRQGLAVLAKAAIGDSDPEGVAWLEDQQCDDTTTSDGGWTAFRADTTADCPDVDPNTFAGADTNSTALALLGLFAQGETNAAGLAFLDAVRTSNGAWTYLGDPDGTSDPSSTGLVMQALLAGGASEPDADGTAAILAVASGCDADAADRGGISFAAGLAPDIFSTTQALPALVGAFLPLDEVTQSAATPTIDCTTEQPGGTGGTDGTGGTNGTGTDEGEAPPATPVAGTAAFTG